MKTAAENVDEVKELFDMVYQWGRMRIVVDYQAPAFQKSIKEIKKSQYICPIGPYDAPEFGEECPICGHKET
jgi:rubrerythrin